MKWAICSVCSDNNGQTAYNQYLHTNLKLMISKPNQWVVYTSNLRFNLGLESIFNNTKFDSFFTIVPSQSPLLESIDGVAINSVAHGFGLNETLQYVDKDTDYLIFLDPDFYLIPDIPLILQHMKQEGYAFWGAPYHQSTTPLLRDFPVGFCLFIDLHQVDINNIDMMPGYDFCGKTKYYPDVGYKLYHKYKNGPLKYNYMIPSIDPTNEIARTSLNFEPFRYTIDTIYKQYKFSYDNPVNHKGTKIDEYFYNDKIYAIHLRAKLFQKRNQEKQRVKLHIKTIKDLIVKLRDNDQYI